MLLKKLMDQGGKFMKQGKMSYVGSVVILLLALISLPKLTVNAQSVITMDKLDLDTGIEASYTILDYPETKVFESTEGFIGRVPEPRSIIGNDDREVVTNTTRVPYRYIGRLNITCKNGEEYTGTGFLVGKNTILTAAHCVYIKGNTISKVMFYPAQNGKELPFNGYKATEIHVPQQYKDAINNNNYNKQQQFDYAVLKLSGNIGTTLGYFALGGYNTVYNENTLINTQATIAGYPGEFGDDSRGYKLYRHKSKILSSIVRKISCTMILILRVGKVDHQLLNM